ncbi:putative nudix domain-protein [Podospora aff. communis PSN243]|uniref:Nudix domain-protein n=1 Tax=Podospora aff. communis PSN243 TaxID=3040156 RepID=A0AAV9GLJ0_9PEZI|nr:putative nudix domain-protein [Podospora aff. communis PSN243]
MSTFTHPRANIPVTLPDGLSQEQVLSFHPFQTWLTTLQNSLAVQSQNPSHPFHKFPYSLRSVTIQSYDLFGKRIGFLKLTSTVSTPDGESLPGAVFLRGASVAMLVMLIPDDAPPDTEERYVLLTVQPRIAAGSLEFVELPAGMVDEEDAFAGTAAKEIKEELGMEIHKSELKNLSDLAAGVESGGGGDGEEKTLGDGNLPRGVFPSPGACDEFIPIFAHERRVPREQLGEWTGKLTGLREEGEKITLKLVRLQDVWKEASRDGKTLAALALWEGLRREGKI